MTINNESPEARLAALRAAPLDGTWVTSTYTQNNGGQCFELMKIEGGVALRDSKDPNGPVLLFTHAEVDAFFNGVVDGEFNSLRGDA